MKTRAALVQTSPWGKLRSRSAVSALRWDISPAHAADIRTHLENPHGRGGTTALQSACPHSQMAVSPSPWACNRAPTEVRHLHWDMMRMHTVTVPSRLAGRWT